MLATNAMDDIMFGYFCGINGIKWPLQPAPPPPPINLGHSKTPAKELLTRQFMHNVTNMQGFTENQRFRNKMIFLHSAEQDDLREKAKLEMASLQQIQHNAAYARIPLPVAKENIDLLSAPINPHIEAENVNVLPATQPYIPLGNVNFNHISTPAYVHYPSPREQAVWKQPAQFSHRPLRKTLPKKRRRRPYSQKGISVPVAKAPLSKAVDAAVHSILQNLGVNTLQIQTVQRAERYQQKELAHSIVKILSPDYVPSSCKKQIPQVEETRSSSIPQLNKNDSMPSPPIGMLLPGRRIQQEMENIPENVISTRVGQILKEISTSQSMTMTMDTSFNVSTALCSSADLEMPSLSPQAIGITKRNSEEELIGRVEEAESSPARQLIGSESRDGSQSILSEAHVLEEQNNNDDEMLLIAFEVIHDAEECVMLEETVLTETLCVKTFTIIDVQKPPLVAELLEIHDYEERNPEEELSRIEHAEEAQPSTKQPVLNEHDNDDPPRVDRIQLIDLTEDSDEENGEDDVDISPNEIAQTEEPQPSTKQPVLDENDNSEASRINSCSGILLIDLTEESDGENDEEDDFYVGTMEIEDVEETLVPPSNTFLDNNDDTPLPESSDAFLSLDELILEEEENIMEDSIPVCAFEEISAVQENEMTSYNPPAALPTAELASSSDLRALSSSPPFSEIVVDVVTVDEDDELIDVEVVQEGTDNTNLNFLYPLALQQSTASPNASSVDQPLLKIDPILDNNVTPQRPSRLKRKLDSLEELSDKVCAFFMDETSEDRRLRAEFRERMSTQQSWKIV